MKNLIYFLLPVALLFSCSNEDILEQQIAQLAGTKDATAVKTVTDKLLNWKGSASDLGEKSRKVAETLRQTGFFGEAIEVMNNSLKNFYEKDKAKESGELLAKIYEENLKKPVQAKLIRQSLTTQPKEEVNPVHEQIREIGREIFADPDKGFNRLIAQEFVTATSNFAMLNPTDSIAPNFLIDAATIARNMGSTDKTLEFFRWVYQKFPNHPKASDAMFYEAFTYDSDLKDFEKAKVAYNAFINQNPKHSFVEQAQIMLSNLGKTDEELLESLGGK